MKWLLFILELVLLSLVFVIEWSLLPSVLGDHWIYLTLLIAFLLASQHRTRSAIILAAAGGYMHDYFSPLPFGIYLLSYLASIVALRLLLLHLFKESSILSLVVVTGISFIVFHISVIAVDGIALIFVPNQLHLALMNSATYQAFATVLWTNVATMAILVGGGSPILRQLMTRLTIRI